MRWIGVANAWLAEADDVDRRHRARNGVWQGLNRATGHVASAVWVASDRRQPLVFIDIDGGPLLGR